MQVAASRKTSHFQFFKYLILLFSSASLVVRMFCVTIRGLVFLIPSESVQGSLTQKQYLTSKHGAHSWTFDDSILAICI